MKRIVVAVLGFLFCTNLFAQKVSDANAEVREAKNFHGISISNAFDVWLTQDSEEKVAVSASDTKWLVNIIVEVKGGVLHIGWNNKARWTRGNKKLKAYISFKNIDQLTVSGACDLNIVGTLKADDLKVSLSGASDLDGQIDIQKLSFDLNGASDAKLKGTALQLNIEASGASSFKGFGLTTDYCNAKASGASDIKVVVNKELNATASGASDIDYKGAGVARDISKSGASSVSRRN
jgi:hypothetical protein